MTLKRITLSGLGLSKQEGVFELDNQCFSLVEKWQDVNGDISLRIIIQTPVEAKAYADFVYQQLQVARTVY